MIEPAFSLFEYDGPINGTPITKVYALIPTTWTFVIFNDKRHFEDVIKDFACWRDGSVVKSTGCSSRKLDSGS